MNVELKRIAEKKIEQLGGDVCGVLVRKDGKLAAVDEHGRVQWLQSGQGAEAVGWQFYQDGKWWYGDDRIKDHRKNTREAGFRVRDVYAAPQPAQQVSVPEGWRECLQEMVQAMHDYEMSVEEGAPYKHRAMMDRAHALLSAAPHPEGDEWVKCSQKDPADADGYKVWFSPDGIRSYLLAPSVLAKSTRKQGYWKPTGLKRPQPPQEGA